MRHVLISFAIAVLPAFAAETLPQSLAQATTRVRTAAMVASPACRQTSGDSLTKALNEVVTLTPADPRERYDAAAKQLMTLSKTVKGNANQCVAAVATELDLARLELLDAAALAKPTPPPYPFECRRLVRCLDALQPGTGPHWDVTYGLEGTCMKSTEADSCALKCARNLINLMMGEKFHKTPACTGG